MESLSVRHDAYLTHALRFKSRELQLQAEFMDWLPENIIDCHVHCNLSEHVMSMDERTLHHMMSTFPSFTLEESSEIHRLFYPGKNVRSLRFPNVFRGIDHKSANQYLLENSNQDDRVALFGLPEDVDYTTRMLAHPRVSALKMYPSYLDPPAERIYQYFRPEILETAQDLGIPIILHPPRIITRCGEDLENLLNDFPRLKVALAHLGLSKLPVTGLREVYERIAKFPFLYLDTAMNPSDRVVGMAMEVFGSERIMFGSDEPLCLIRAQVYTHPELGERLLADYNYHWADPKEQQQYMHLLDAGVVHTLWQTLIAIKTVIELLPVNQREPAKEQIFKKNAEGFFNF